MKTLHQIMVIILSLVAMPTIAQVPTQSQAEIRAVAEDFLKQQVSGLSQQTKVTLGNIDPRLNLAKCANMIPFLPPGSRIWGKMSVGLRCTAPTAWTIYVSANVQVFGDYYVTTATLTNGHIITEDDLSKVTGELSSLPATTVINPNQAIGRILGFSVMAGSPLRADTLKIAPAVQQGQAVKVIASGTGFTISTEGLALATAGVGQQVRAKTSSGQLVSGTAREGGIIEIRY